MSTAAYPAEHQESSTHPVDVRIEPALDDRNRLTTGFRFILAVPHLLLVGGPVGLTLTWGWGGDGMRPELAGGAGVLGAVAGIAALIAWFALVFTGRYPDGLRDLATLYLRWRVRALAYVSLLRDEYPPFGDAPYPAGLLIEPAAADRDRVSIAFRIVLAIPHLIAVWLLGFAWGLATLIAWFTILITGSHPRSLYDFGVGVLRWSTRVDAYLLLLHDEYPPFSLDR
jgi:hypothetical protein